MSQSKCWSSPLICQLFSPHYSTCLYLCVNVKVTWNTKFQPASNSKKTGSNQSNKHSVQAPFLFRSLPCTRLGPCCLAQVIHTWYYQLHHIYFVVIPMSPGGYPILFYWTTWEGNHQTFSTVNSVGQNHKGSSQNLLPSAPFLQLKCLEGVSYPGRCKSYFTMHRREKYDMFYCTTLASQVVLKVTHFFVGGSRLILLLTCVACIW